MGAGGGGDWVTPCGDRKEIWTPKSQPILPPHDPLDCQTNQSGKGRLGVCPALSARAKSQGKSQRMWVGRGRWWATQSCPEESSNLPGTSALIGSFKKITILRKRLKRGIYTLCKFKKRQATSMGFYGVTHPAAAIVLKVLAYETRREQLKWLSASEGTWSGNSIKLVFFFHMGWDWGRYWCWWFVRTCYTYKSIILYYEIS